MFDKHPKGLYALALANTGERFGYYTMLAVFVLFLQANFGYSASTAGLIYSVFLGFVYFMPLFGGIAADKLGYRKMVTIGIAIMFFGYLLLSLPLGADRGAVIAMGGALLLITIGTGLFKGNLQVMVGNLYDDPEYADKRDSGFSLFYMAINVGSMFAPTAAIKIMEWAQRSLGASEADAYPYAFAVACISLIVSIIIFYLSALMGPTQAMVTGSGFAMLGLAVGILDGVIFRLLFSYLFANLMGLEVVGYFLASALARLGPVIICGGYFISGKWRTRKLLVEKAEPAEETAAAEA